ncbi:MAG: MlaD family protein [Pseudobdellovibrionaceae bacterium]|jgi:phospholipid/cholesterol/gamma-HCH transport system substrate-binding protein
METNLKNQLQTGLFVLIGIGIILFSIISLDGDKWFLTQKTRVYAEFQEVQGLANGSVVSLSGLTVGNVESIQYLTENKVLRVTLKIEKSALAMIPSDSRVEIRTQGALGDKYIMIMPGQANTFLTENSQLQTDKSKDLIGVIAERGKEADKVFEIINELYVMTKTMNHEGRFEKIMSNFQDAASELRQTAKESRLLISEIRHENPKKISDSLEKMDRILGKIDRGEGTLGALINDPSLHDSLKGLLGTSERKSNMKSLIRTTIQKSDE